MNINECVCRASSNELVSFCADASDVWKSTCTIRKLVKFESSFGFFACEDVKICRTIQPSIGHWTGIVCVQPHFMQMSNYYSYEWISKDIAIVYDGSDKINFHFVPHYFNGIGLESSRGTENGKTQNKLANVAKQINSEIRWHLAEKQQQIVLNSRNILFQSEYSVVLKSSQIH